MLNQNCKVIFAGNTYTLNDFANYIAENGIGVLSEGKTPSDFLNVLIERYDTTKMDESVLELRARLNMQKMGIELPKDGLLTPEQVKEYTVGLGQLTDYETQQRIRYNTYSGLAITGIAANYGKVLSYLFEMCRITKLIDVSTGKIYEVGSDEVNTMLKEAKTKELERLMEINRNLKPYERASPKLTKKYHFKINGVTIDGFVRNTRNLSDEVRTLRRKYENLVAEGKQESDAAKELLAKIVEATENTKNIFETIDTVINLAIDNVKMQALPHLGITNANSNMFLSLIGMGVPETTVTKIFTTPIMASISEGSRWTHAKLGKLIKEKRELLEKINDREVYVNYTKGFTNDQKEFINRLLKLTEDEKNEDNSGIMRYVDLDPADLEDMYTGNIDDNKKLVLELQLLTLAKQMIPITEELFDYANIFSSLRGIPNKSWKTDSTIERIENRATLVGAEESEEKVLKAMREMLISNYKNSEEYATFYGTLPWETNLSEATRLEAEHLQQIINEFADAHGIIGATPKSEVRSAYTNKLLRRDNVRNTVGKNTVFEAEDVSVLRLPHVRAAYRSMVQFKKILQDTFAIHAPTVANFVRNIVSSANFFSPYDSLEKTELVSQELLRFLTSSLSFKIAGEVVNTFISPELKYSTRDANLLGIEAWKQELVDRVLDISTRQEFVDNQFLNSIEFKKAFNDVTYTEKANAADIMLLRSDKMSDVKFRAMIKKDFDQLVRHPDAEVRQLARDMFKYAIVSDGLYYKKTTFSLVFPAQWGVSYSSAVDARLNMLIPKDMYATDINLASIQDQFLWQLLRNVPNLVSRPSGKTIVPNRVTVRDKKRNVYHGSDLIEVATENGIENKKVHFDLKIDTEYNPNNKRFVKNYDLNTVYMLIDTPGTKASYYREIVKGDYEGHYQINLLDIEEGFTLQPLSTTLNRIVNSIDILNDTALNYQEDGYVLQKGEIIGAINKKDVTSKEIVWYEVMKVGKGDKKSYELRRLTNSTPLTSPESVKRYRELTSTMFSERAGASMTVSDITPFVNRAMKDQLVIIADTGNLEVVSEANKPHVYDLPIYDISPNLTPEEQAKLLDLTIEAISKIPLEKSIIVHDKVLDKLKIYPKLKDKLSKLLYSEANFVDASMSTVEGRGSRKTNKFNEALKRYDLGVINIEWNADLKKLPNNAFTTNKTGRLREAPIGAVIYSGNKYYAVTDNVSEKSLTLIQLPEGSFANIKKLPLDIDAFLQELKNNC